METYRAGCPVVGMTIIEREVRTESLLLSKRIKETSGVCLKKYCVFICCLLEEKILLGQ